MKIPSKSRKEIELEINNIYDGKDHTPRGLMLKRAMIPLKMTMSRQEIIDLFVGEYVKKYGELSSGKKSLENLKKESGMAP